MQPIGIVTASQHLVVYIPALVATEFLDSAHRVFDHTRSKGFLTTYSVSVVFLLNCGTVDAVTQNKIILKPLCRYFHLLVWIDARMCAVRCAFNGHHSYGNDQGQQEIEVLHSAVITT